MGDGTDGGDGTWRGAAMDLALAELEQPFGSAARTRPILMATSSAECAPAAPATCHVSRALPRPAPGPAQPARPRPHARLRIVGADLVPPDTCARAASYWNAVRDRALCLAGPELCAVPTDLIYIFF